MPHVRLPRIAVPLLLAWLAMALVGCVPTGTIVWSPDGTRAAYGVLRLDHGNPVEARWSVLDGDGKPAGTLAGATPFLPWYGGFLPVAWSPDSKSIYYARRDGANGPTTLCRSTAGEVESGPSLGDVDVLQVRASPDGRWLAVLCGPRGTIGESKGKAVAKTAESLGLVGVDLGDGSVREVAAAAGLGCCFTGPDRLAFVRAGGDHDRDLGEVVEVSLSAADAKPAELADVLVADTGELEPTADGLAFIAAQHVLPSTRPGTRTNDDDHQFTLYHWKRDTNVLSAVADRVVFVSASPDGTRLLVLTADHDLLTLVVMRPDGSDRRVLRKMPDPKPSMLPAWHGNDRFTFQSPAGAAGQRDGADATVYEVVDVPIAADGGPTRTLSGGWPDEMRPACVTGKSK